MYSAEDWEMIFIFTFYFLSPLFIYPKDKTNQNKTKTKQKTNEKSTFYDITLGSFEKLHLTKNILC